MDYNINIMGDYTYGHSWFIHVVADPWGAPLFHGAPLYFMGRPRYVGGYPTIFTPP